MALTILSFASCRKDPDPIPTDTSCYSKVYGVRSEAIHITDTAAAGQYGFIDTAGGQIGVVSVVNSAFSKQGAFSNADSCYYTIKTVRGSYTGNVLCRVTAGSSVSYLTDASVKKLSYQAIVFNRATNRLYCLYNDTVNKVGEVTISGGSFSVTELVRLKARTTILTGITADNNSGALYCLTGDLSVSYLERYMPGATASSVTDTLQGGWGTIMGLRYNVNDSKLYYLKINGSPGAVVYREDPATKAQTMVATLQGYIDHEYFSAALDPCRNEYVLSTRTGVGWSSQMYVRINLASGLVYKNAIPALYTGLDVAY
ncbi:hypothetical protein GCM10023093_08170 [Nemorincola caseinilytica]|uniref:DUF4374 domain-containing protein n=1 Tax=Nemorincola caseinilytica TaxID=2054315 RepID=A0ABP8N8A3_9BACT